MVHGVPCKDSKKGYFRGNTFGYTLGVADGYNEYEQLYGETCGLVPAESIEPLCWKILTEKYSGFKLETSTGTTTSPR